MNKLSIISKSIAKIIGNKFNDIKTIGFGFYSISERIFITINGIIF